jgi:hypothetical protein
MEFSVLVLRKGTRAPNGHPWVAKPSQGQGRGMGFAKGCLKQARGQMARKYCDTSGRRVVESLILCNVTQVATTWSHSNHEAIPRPRAENGIGEWMKSRVLRKTMQCPKVTLSQKHGAAQAKCYIGRGREACRTTISASPLGENNLGIPTRRQHAHHPRSDETDLRQLKKAQLQAVTYRSLSLPLDSSRGQCRALFIAY